jgi:hypothetical protein
MNVRIPDVIRRGELIRIEPHEKFRDAVQECLNGEEWVPVKGDTVGQMKVDCFVKKIAWNPSTDAYAILTVILSVL